MSDATPLSGAHHEGFVTVSEDAPHAMIQLRADLSDPAVAAAVRSAIGAEVPQPLCIASGDRGRVAWMTPDELLLFPDHDDAVRDIGQALQDRHHLVLAVSDMRCCIRLDGPAVREVLAKVVPVDAFALEAGTFRRTRLAQVSSAVWLSGPETAHILCFRSVARYAFDVLSVASRQGGEIGLVPAFPGTS